MIQPAPTTVISRTLARGVFIGSRTGAGDGKRFIVLGLRDTSYQLHLVPSGPAVVEVGARLVGTIHAEARRVDTVHTGGAYIEPVMGEPRRVQGRVIGADDDTRTLIVDAAVPIHCRLTDARQRPSQFPMGELVSFDVMDGTTFVTKT